MTRPSSESEYLASLVPASARFSRRSVLRGALGVGAVVAGGSALSACGSNGSSAGAGGGGTAAASGTVTLGSNQSDAVPKAGIAKVMQQFESDNSGLKVAINTVDHNTFQSNINTYLQGNPDDVFAWFSGYRMRFFASKGLVGDISDVWKNLDGMTDALKTACTGDDGKQYLVPSTTYPWAIHYRKSLWDKHGYTEPKTLDELTTLCKRMQKDGLAPIAFADKDGWPAMGTFDILNLRVNGYDYHVSLMAGKEDWTGDKVKKVFDTWKGLLPYHQTDALGRTWQESAQSLEQKKTGMYYCGTFLAQQFNAAEQKDLKFFNFPEVDSSVGSDAIEAPVDGWMMSKRPKNEAGAKKLLLYLGGPEAQTVQVTSDTSVVGSNTKIADSKYTDLQKAEDNFISKAKHISQFLDRDSRPDFAQNVVTPALQSFIKNPADVSSILKQIEDQKKALFS